MRMTLVAVAAIGLTAGACSLRSPGGTGAYSALQSETAGLAPTAAFPAPVPSGFSEIPDRGAMPGDHRGPVASRSGGGVEPVAALSASTRARSQWETLRPGDLTRTPTAAPPASALSSGGMVTGALAPSKLGTTSAAMTWKGTKPETKSYDREAAMQSLINGGRSAGKGICSGC